MAACARIRLPFRSVSFSLEPTIQPSSLMTDTGNRSHDGARSILALQKPQCEGSARFAVASLLVYSTVAFAQRWMYQRFTLPGAYAVWTLLFMSLGGWALKPLVVQPRAKRTFWVWFALAFFSYAACWMASYFTLRRVAGEWLGSLAGSAALALVLAAAFNAWSSLSRIAVVLFVAHSVGYFFGEWLHHALHGKIGMLLWGLCYGLGFGFGLTQALYFAQTADAQPARKSAD